MSGDYGGLQVVKLSTIEERALKVFRLDGVGLDRLAAPSIIASNAGCTVEEANEVLISLMAKDLVVPDDQNSERLGLNIPKAELTSVGFAPQLDSDRIVKQLGPPHSHLAVETLSLLLTEEPEYVLLATEITSPKAFKALESRARANKHTIVFMVNKRYVSTAKRLHYEEIVAEWKRLLTGNESLSKNVEIRTLERPMPDLYTTALSRRFARMNVRDEETTSSRDGVIFQFPRGTTGYSLLEHRYRQALRGSAPTWRIHPVKYLLTMGMRSVPLTFFVLLGLLLTYYDNKLAATGSALFIGFVSSVLASRLGVHIWWRPQIYQK